MSGMLMVRRQARRPNEIGLFTVDEMSFDELMKVPTEKTSLVAIKSPRNPRHHALAWALAAKLAEACDWLHDAEDAMNYLKVRARHVTWVTNPLTGETVMRPKSIAFESIDQVRFSRLFDRFVWIITSEVLPGVDDEALRSNVLSMVDGINNAPALAAPTASDATIEHKTEPAELMPPVGSAGDEERSTEPLPVGLSSEDRELLRFYVEELDAERADYAVEEVRKRFWKGKGLERDSALAIAAGAITDAHRMRVTGEISIDECARLCREAAR